MPGEGDLDWSSQLSLALREPVESIDLVSADALKEMFKRGVQYAAGGE